MHFTIVFCVEIIAALDCCDPPSDTALEAPVPIGDLYDNPPDQNEATVKLRCLFCFLTDPLSLRIESRFSMALAPLIRILMPLALCFL